MPTHKTKVLRPERNVRALSPLAKLRAVQYPFPRAAVVMTELRYDGFVVLWRMAGLPPGYPPGGYRWYKTMVIMRARPNVTEIFPTNAEVVTVSFREGFDPSPDNLFPYVRQYIKNLNKLLGGNSPFPGDTPVIT